MSITAIANPGDDATQRVQREAMRKAEQFAEAMEAVGLWDLSGEPTELWHQWEATRLEGELRVCECPCWRRGHRAVCKGVAYVSVDIGGVAVAVCIPCAKDDG